MITLLEYRLYRNLLKILTSILSDGFHMFTVILDGRCSTENRAQFIHTAGAEGGVINVIFLGFIAHVFKYFCLSFLGRLVDR